jgi:hypothetical protein
MAVGKSDGCIESATFEVVSGQDALGTVITQQTPCSVWDYEGGVTFKDLTPTIPMTLRASAAGYKTTEQSIRANVRSGQAIIFELEQLP